MNPKSFFYYTLALLVWAGCATESTTPLVAHYLPVAPAPGFAAQVELLKGTMIQLRSADVLLEAQAQLIEGAVGVQFYVINLSGQAFRLNARDFSLRDAKGLDLRPLTIKEVLQPVRDRAAALEEKTNVKSMPRTTADAVVNPSAAYDGGSTNERLAKTLRGESNALEKTMETPFTTAKIPVNKKVWGMLYFDHPASWPVTLNVQAGGQAIAAIFLNAVENP